MLDKDYLAVSKEERESIFDYEPFLRVDDEVEIPCYRIYWDGDAIAQTNEDMPKELQHQAAWLMTYARDFVEAIDRVIDVLRSAPGFLTSEDINSHEFAEQLEKISKLGVGQIE